MRMLYVGLFKEAVWKDMLVADSPLVFFAYCAERWALITNMTAKKLFQLQGQTPYSVTFGEKGDISIICNFGWYEWVYFRETTAAFPYPAHVLGRYLGKAKNEGNEMTRCVLMQNEEIVPRRKLCSLSPEELSRDSEILKRSNFT